MEEATRNQIDLLKKPCVSEEFLSRLFMIEWPPQGDFTTDYAVWEQQRGRGQSCSNGLRSRWSVETFLQDHRLQPLPWAAAGLGMKPESLRSLLPLLPQLGLRRKYELYPGLIDEQIGDDLIRSLKGLRFRTFGSHDSFCELLHGTLRDILSIQIDPWFCATSVELGEYPRLFAGVIDSVTLQPLSVKHAVWLNLGKPMNLPPDRCSKLFYVRHRDEMRPLLTGRGEPERLDVYDRFVRQQQVAVNG